MEEKAIDGTERNMGLREGDAYVHVVFLLAIFRKKGRE